MGTPLYDKITGNLEIAAIIATRMYPVALPKTPTVPAVVYFFDSSTSVDSLARGVTLHYASSSQNPSVDQYRINYDSDNVAMDLRSKTFDPGASSAKAFI